jgi:hypothetical protein
VAGGTPKIPTKGSSEIYVGTKQLLTDAAKSLELMQGGRNPIEVGADTYGWALPGKFDVILGHTYRQTSTGLNGQVANTVGPRVEIAVSIPAEYSLGSLRDPSTNEFTVPTPIGKRLLTQAQMIQAVKEAGVVLEAGSVVTDIAFDAKGARVQYENPHGMIETASVNAFFMAKSLEGQLRVLNVDAVPNPTSSFSLDILSPELASSGWVYRFQTAGGVRTLTEAEMGVALKQVIGINLADAKVGSLTLKPDGGTTVMLTYANGGIMRFTASTENVIAAVKTYLESHPAAQDQLAGGTPAFVPPAPDLVQVTRPGADGRFEKPISSLNAE